MTLVLTLGTGRRELPSFAGGPFGIARLASAQTFAAISTLLAAGVLLAILTTPDALWWHLHFSRLGTFSVLSSAVFNGTLMGVGSMIALLARRVLIELRAHGTRSRSHRHAPVVLSSLVASMGLHLAVVGLIPINTFTALHDWAAFGITLSFAALLIAAPCLLRGTNRPMRGRTIPAAVVLVGGFAALNTGLINLALFELIGFTAMFVWVSFFLGCLTPRAAASAVAPATAGSALGVTTRSEAPAERACARPAHTLKPLTLSRMAGGLSGATGSCRATAHPRMIAVPSTAARAPRAHPKAARGPAPTMSARAWDLTRARPLHPAVLPQASGRSSRSRLCSSSASA